MQDQPGQGGVPPEGQPQPPPQQQPPPAAQGQPPVGPVQGQATTHAAGRLPKVWLLSVFTCGIYGWIWYYRLCKELGEWSQGQIETDPTTSVLAVSLGGCVLVPPFISWAGTLERVRQAQQMVGLEPTAESGPWILYMFLASYGYKWLQTSSTRSRPGRRAKQSDRRSRDGKRGERERDRREHVRAHRVQRLQPEHVEEGAGRAAARAAVSGDDPEAAHRRQPSPPRARCRPRVRAARAPATPPPSPRSRRPRGRPPGGWRAASAQADPDGLVSRYASRPARPCSRPTPEALKPPNGAGGVVQAPDVHVDGARLEQRREPVGVADVARPDAGREPVLGVVRAPRDLLDRLVGQRDEHGPEDLLARDREVVARWP